MSIPSPSKAFMKRLQKMIYAFVWKNKKDKISRDQLSNDYVDGGLRLFKVDLFFEALKSTWIRRIVTGNVDEKGLLLFSKITGLTIKDFEKGSNFTLNVAKNINNMFWKEVLVAWCKIQRKHIPNTVEDILRSCIWENDVFKTMKKSINLKTWCKAGIYYVNDLVHIEGRFMTLRELKDTYGLRSNFLEYYRVLSTIKNALRQLVGPNVDIFRTHNPFIPFHLSLILKDKRGCKSLCSLLASFREPKSINRWEFKLNVNFSRGDWKMYYLIPFNCTMDTKLRWFQYRILNRFLTTNSFMCKIGQRIDNICTFCKKEAETIEHLFVECKEVTNIWSKLQNWIQIKLGIPVVLSKSHILFGIDLKKCNSAINLILLLTKFYIYRTRCQGSTLSFLSLQREIESYYTLEKYILLKSLSWSNFKNKWQMWKGLFE